MGGGLGALARADPIWAVAASASAALCLWTLSWRHVRSAVGVGISWHSLVVDYYTATFVNYVTLLGRTSGAPVSVYTLSTDHRAPYDESLATVATVTTLNVARMRTFARLGALAVARASDVSDRVTPILGGVGAICVAVLLGTLGTERAREHAVGCGTAVTGAIPGRTDIVDGDGIDRRVREFFTLLDRVGDSRWELLEVLTLSYVGWVLFAAPLWLAAKALGVHLDSLVVAFVVPANTLASVVPTPGGIGGVEIAIVVLSTELGGTPRHRERDRATVPRRGLLVRRDARRLRGTGREHAVRTGDAGSSGGPVGRRPAQIRTGTPRSARYCLTSWIE